MKLFKRLFCGFLAGIALLLCGCGTPKERDLSVECAPCTVKEIWNWNEEICKEFYHIRSMASISAMNAVKCTVNGEEWSAVKQMTEDLPEGAYQIRFYTEKGFTISVQSQEGGESVRKEIPYEKDLTLSVTVSTKYKDICDLEYRQANGLWIDPSQEQWYKDFIKEMNKK